MSGCQNHMVGQDLHAGGKLHPHNTTLLLQDIIYLAVEMDLTAKVQDGLTHVLDDVGQFVGADMGAGIVQYAFRISDERRVGKEFVSMLSSLYALLIKNNMK